MKLPNDHETDVSSLMLTLEIKLRKLEKALLISYRDTWSGMRLRQNKTAVKNVDDVTEMVKKTSFH